MDFGVKIIQITEGDDYCQANGVDYYTNRSMASHPHIYLGIYEG